MGDRPAERGVGRPLRVDVDPLAVLGRGGEGVDALLGDGEPVGQADLAAEHGLELARAQPVAEDRHVGLVGWASGP